MESSDALNLGFEARQSAPPSERTVMGQLGACMKILLTVSLRRGQYAMWTERNTHVERIESTKRLLASLAYIGMRFGCMKCLMPSAVA